MRGARKPIGRRFAQGQDGAVIVIFALALPVILAGLALAMETGLWFVTQRKLQHAADSATFSAAVALASGDDEAAVTDTARRVALASGLRADSGTVRVAFPEDDQVEVVLTDSRPYMILRALDVVTDGPDRFGGGITLSARAVASITAEEDERLPVCLHVLERRNDQAMEVDGNARLDFGGCTIEVASTDEDALDIGGNARVTAACVTVAGGIDGARRITSTVCPEPRPNTVPAPLAVELVLLEPPENPRSVPNRRLQSDEFDIETTYDDHPSGVPMRRFQGGLTLRNNRSYTFGPGLYIIDGGRFRAGNGTELNATDGTAFYLMNGAYVDFDNGAIVRLVGMDGGPWHNVVLFDSNDDDSEETHDLVTAQLDGIVYMPRAEINLSGGSGVGTGCFLIAVGEFRMTGNANITAECDLSNVDLPGYTGNDPDGTSIDIRLIE